ncbi:hypothetical protein [Pelagibacterium montanilacus]|uniref:hypothetical protein n=1 Tax=Pelagibacterium montanilacus TaxID=2185280 RepID=UPI000F8E892C|nr:hypothetical protein [Pelagibacterium montanilacus]
MRGNSHGGGAITIDLAAIGRWVCVASAIIIGLGIVREVVIWNIGNGTALKDLRHIWLDAELSLPAYYSSLVMLACAAIILVIGAKSRRERGGDGTHWLILGIGFVVMAIDESVSIHESLMMPVRNGLGLSGVFHYAWVVPGLIGVAALGLYFLPFLLRLPRRSAMLFVAAGGLYLGGALGVEMIGGLMEETRGKESLGYIMSMVVEESLEIIGLSVFLCALVDHFARQWTSVGIALVASEQARERAVVAQRA